MKIGVYLNAQHPAGDDPARRLAEMVDQVRLIRQRGYDSIWSGEHHITDGYHYFPLLSMLHRLAAEAEGLDIGTNIVLLPLHNPIELAEIGAFLDVATGGRFMLGVGLGYREEEFAMYRVPMKERASRLEEGVEIIRRLWSEDKVTFKGRHWSFDDLTIRPRPTQSPRPPIVIASQVDAGIKRAARIGDGWTSVPVTRVEGVAKEVDMFAEARHRGRACRPAAHRPHLRGHLRQGRGDRATPRSAVSHREVRGLCLVGLARPEDGQGPKPGGPAARPRQGSLRRRHARAGGRGLVGQHKAGMTHVAMRMSWPGMSQDDILAGIDLVGREVLPEVRRRIAAG